MVGIYEDHTSKRSCFQVGNFQEHTPIDVKWIMDYGFNMVLISDCMFEIFKVKGPPELQFLIVGPLAFGPLDFSFMPSAL